MGEFKLRLIEKLNKFTNCEWDIFDDLKNAIEEGDDKIYMLAENMSNKGLGAVYNILYTIANESFKAFDYKYLRFNFADFEIELSNAIKEIQEYNKEYSYAGDDNWTYAIHTMKLPLDIKKFCEAFDRKDIIKWVNDSKICQRATNIYWQLEGIWDFINVRHRQYYENN